MKRLGYILQAIFIRASLGIAGLFPLRWRTRFVGAITMGAVSIAPPLRRRAMENLALIYPEMSARQRRSMTRKIARNIGATLTEILFNEDFAPIARNYPIKGPGLAALTEARAQGKGAIILSGHFGQWEVIRHALMARGLETGAIYRPNNNPYYEPLFRAGIELSGKPIIAKGFAGNRQMLKHIKGGGFLAILPDQYVNDGEMLTFLGQPAVTSLAAAELALRYDVPLVPIFAPRNKDGILATLEAPIPHTTPAEMMQEFNDRLGAWVRAHPTQWYWVHQRWKVFPWNLPQDD